MSDGRSEDRDQPGGTSGRKAPAASDLLAMWVTGKTSEEEPAEPAEQAAPEADDVPEEEAYAESLWPGDEPPAAGGSPDPVGGEQWWPYAEPDASAAGSPGAAEAAAPAAADPAPADGDQAPASMDPRGQDMSTTASWTLDDFERYIRNQKDNELADWIGGAPASGSSDAAAEPDDAFSPEPADPPASPGPTAPRLASVPDVTDEQLEDDDGDDEDDDPDAVDPLAGPEVEVEWNPPEGEAPAPEPVVADDVADAEAEDLVEEPAEEPVVGPDPGQAPLFDEPAADADTDVVTLAPTDSPAPVEDVWPEPPAQPEPEAREDAPEEAPEEAQPEAAAEAGPTTYDLQEWYDDYGLRWVSGDGGYTWYSDDGQGWDAEHSEVIPVAAGFVPFPGDPRSPGYTPPSAAPAPREEPAGTVVEHEPVPPEPEPQPEPDPEPEPKPAVAADEPEDPDGWPASTGSTAHHYAGLAEDDRWPDETGSVPRVDPEPGTQVMSAVSAPTEPTAPAAEPDPSYNLYADPPATSHADDRGTASEDPFPDHVEYKPRGAYRPLLILLFVGAAVVAVAAILWAVSKGNQAVWGIAAAITGFTLFFWWGLLSWTPTLVSIDGPMLEVSRGSDGERFDLRSPKLQIHVDDDVYSRSWRTTIVRPNGTELVIPSSAVDAEEFSRIVAHHRSGVSR